MPAYYYLPAGYSWYDGTNATTVTTPIYISVAASTAATTLTTSYYSPTVAVWRTPVWADTRTYYDNSAQVISRQRRIVESHKLEARQRAKELLLEHLTEAQRETFTKNNWFVVEGGKTKTRYKIHAEPHMIGNIEVLETVFTIDKKRKGDGVDKNERVKHRLCGHCDLAKIPLGDQLLAQKMMLEFAEDDFLAIANRHAA